MRCHHIPCVFLAAFPVVAQSNAVPGTDVDLYEMGSASYYGRTGPEYPQGTIGFAFGHSMCNAGSLHIPWDFEINGQMQSTHPKIAFLVVKESDGRMFQISNRSFLKHSRTAFNFPSGDCAPCSSGPSNTFRIGCSDTYGPGFNGSHRSLGPPDEIDPWLGTFDSVGSYFDRGDPSVGGAAAMDNVYSLSTFGFSSVKNRVNVRESDLVSSGSYRAQCHVVVLGEPLANRGNNVRSKPISFSRNGVDWTVTTSGLSRTGSVLTEWAGATTDVGGNGNDDGRFLVAVNVTGPANGLWHYEYAIHNIDNSRGAATFRIPVDSRALVSNVGFHDIDDDSRNDWSYSRAGDEVTFSAGANNALRWNSIYNFWFDSSAAPTQGSTTLDQALLGSGQAAVTVSARVPYGTISAAVESIGHSNCGGAGLSLSTSGLPVVGATMDLVTSSVPAGATGGVTILSFGRANPPIDLAALGMTDCEYYGAGEDAHLMYSLSSGSTARLTLQLPNDGSLVGMHVVAQSFIAGTSLTSLGVVGSNGLLLGAGL